MIDLSTLLRKNPVFSSLSEEDLNLMQSHASLREYGKNEKVILYGDIWPYLFLVGEGSINAIKESSEGRSLMVTTFWAGDLFWGLAFFQENSPMPATLEAREASLLYLWPRDLVLPLIERNGRVGWELCRLMAVRMQRASEILEGLAFQPVAGRLARLLLDHFKVAGDTAISRHLTLDEMAARIGTTREVVCRFLHRFSDQGLIEITRTEFSVTDHKGLNELAQRIKG